MSVTDIIKQSLDESCHSVAGFTDIWIKDMQNYVGCSSFILTVFKSGINQSSSYAATFTVSDFVNG